MLRPEKKFRDTALTTTVVGTSGTTMQGATTDELTAIINGTGENERNGSRVRLMAIHGRLQFHFPDVNAAALLDKTDDHVRIMIGIDKQANKAHATLVQILESGFIHAFRNIENIHRFIFLYDKTFVMNNTTVAGNGATDDKFDIGSKVKYLAINLRLNMPMYFDGTTGQKGEVTSHQIFMFAISARGTITMNNNWRIRYYG